MLSLTTMINNQVKSHYYTVEHHWDESMVGDIPKWLGSLKRELARYMEQEQLKERSQRASKRSVSGCNLTTC